MCFISSFFRRLFGGDSSDFDDQVEKRLNEWKVEKLSSPYLFSIPEKRISEQLAYYNRPCDYQEYNGKILEKEITDRGAFPTKKEYYTLDFIDRAITRSEITIPAPNNLTEIPPNVAEAIVFLNINSVIISPCMLIAIPDIFETSENIQIFYCKGNLRHSKKFKKTKIDSDLYQYSKR